MEGNEVKLTKKTGERQQRMNNKQKRTAKGKRHRAMGNRQ
jgi:hypothetical protein